MAMEFSIRQMAIATKGIINMVREMVKGFLPGLMELVIRGNINRIKNMDTEYTLIRVVLSIIECGKMVKNMEKES